MNQVKDWIAALKGVGMVGERKALALLCLGFYAFFFSLLGLLLLGQDDPTAASMAPMLIGLGACYGLAFYALAADWFWARWFATGLGYWGLTTAALIIMQTRMVNGVFLFFFGTHALVWLLLLGDRMAAAYDSREDWQKRFGLDEQGVHRIRNTVTRVSTGLPMLILWALAPKEDGAGMTALVGMVALSATVFGLAAVLQARTWGLAAIGAGGVVALAGLIVAPAPASLLLHEGGQLAASAQATLSLLPLFSAVAGGFLLAGVAPYLRPVAAYLRRGNSRH